MYKTYSIIEAVYYLLKKLGPTDRIKIVKLLYLADKYHLLRYGRTVTTDDYFAMGNGPVGSTVRDVLVLNEIALSPKEYKYASKLLKKIDEYKLAINESEDVQPLFEMLSETDKEALDFVINTFGNKKYGELIEYTHKYPEWKQHKEALESNLTKREPISTEEMLSTLDNDPLMEGITKENIELARSILKGDI